MARAPRSLVPKTSGAGTSRYAYQHAYAMGQRGTGGGPLKPALVGQLNKGALSTKPTRMSMTKPSAEKPRPFNISYGDTWGDGTF